MSNLIPISLTFIVSFFLSNTIIFFGRQILSKNTSYFTTFSAITSAAIAIWWTLKVIRDVRRNTVSAARRIIEERKELTRRITAQLLEAGIIKDDYMHLAREFIDAAVLEALFGGSCTILSGMNKDILREGVRYLRLSCSDSLTDLFLDCHEAVQYKISGENTPKGIIHSSVVWVSFKLAELKPDLLRDEEGDILCSVFENNLLSAIYMVKDWIKHPER